jgi:hypothetical protein
VKEVLALALLAVLGFAAAGCGSGKKNDLSTRIAQNYSGGSTTVVTLGGPDLGSTTAGSVGHPITVTGTAITTIPNVRAGTLVVCSTRHGAGAKVKVPRVGGAVAEGQQQLRQLGQKPAPTQSINVTHLENGSITVSCTRSH